MDALVESTPVFASLSEAHVRRGGRRVLHDVSLRFAAGTVTLLLGPNGAGKTTLLHTLCGAIVPNAGTVEIAGLDPRRARRGEVRIGLVPQDVALYGRLTVRENIEVFATLLGWPCPPAKVRDVMTATWLDEVADRRASALSGGLQRRVNLACALAGDPHLLLLDEPTVGLDLQARRAMAAVLRDWAARSGTTMVIATHDIDELETTGDHVVVLRDGAVVSTGSPAAIVRSAFAEGHQRVDVLLADGPDGGATTALARRGFAALDDRATWRGMLALDADGRVPPLGLPDGTVREIRVRRPGLADAFATLVGTGRA